MLAMCVCACVTCTSGNRCSAASNFEFLNETLREARLCELAIEERKLKLEEDRLKFEHEKWHRHQHEITSFSSKRTKCLHNNMGHVSMSLLRRI